MKTLKIQWPIGQTFLQAILLLIIFCIFAELFARTDMASQLLGKYEFFGSAHPHFDQQLINIRERAEKEGRIDCIIIGNSQVLYGVNPAIIEQVYFEETGKKIVCQNFGLGGLTPVGALPVIRMLVDMYDPFLIIYGTSIIDYTFHSRNNADRSLISSSWLSYKLGNFSLDGWLIENYSSFRYYLGIDHYFFNQNINDFTVYENGYSPKEGRTESSLEDQINFADSILPKSELQNVQINNLHEILKLQSKEMDVIVLELPITSTVFEIRPDTKDILSLFRSNLFVLSKKTESKFWLTQETLSLPEGDWHDLIHLNTIGADYFSTQVGKWLTEK